MLDDGTIEPRLRLIRPTEASTFPAKIMEDTHWLEADRAAFTAAWTDGTGRGARVLGNHAAHRGGASAADLEAASRRTKPASTGCKPMTASASSAAVSRPHGSRPRLQMTRQSSRQRRSMPSFSEGKTKVRLAEGMELHRSRVMGVNRIELSGFTEAQKDRLKADGFFSEIIAWKLRLFCPTDSGGVESARSACLHVSPSRVYMHAKVVDRVCHVIGNRRSTARPFAKCRKRLPPLSSRREAGRLLLDGR